MDLYYVFLVFWVFDKSNYIFNHILFLSKEIELSRGNNSYNKKIVQN
jgi:hypothetical protein